MTEKEAETKWCPYARVTNLEGTEPAANRYENEDAGHPDDGWGRQPGSHCIGSACMAWRWAHVPNPAYYEWAQQGGGLITGRPAPLIYLRSETEGHCGLAGQP